MKTLKAILLLLCLVGGQASASEWRTLFEIPAAAIKTGFPGSGQVFPSTASAGFSNLQTFSSTPSINGLTGVRTFPNVIQPGAFTQTTSSTIRFTVCASTSGAVAANASVCTSGGTAPNAYSCDPTLNDVVRVTWPGSSTGTPNGFTLGASATLVSDEIPFVLQSGRPLMTAFDANLTIRAPQITIGTLTSNPQRSSTGCGGSTCFQGYTSKGSTTEAFTSATNRGSAGNNYTLVGLTSFYVCKVEVK